MQESASFVNLNIVGFIQFGFKAFRGLPEFDFYPVHRFQFVSEPLARDTLNRRHSHLGCRNNDLN